jgi:methionine biosynthesis protein MetW
MTAAERIRRDLRLIGDLVPPGSRVLDLGCGDGSLLELLRDERGATVRGIELDIGNIASCIERGVPVVQADLDEGLPDYPDGAFDVVVLSQTLQAIRRPLLVVDEMLRIGRRAIVSFPNFGHWRDRSQLALRGRMPVSDALPYQWYDSPNIRFTTIKDFRDLCRRRGIDIEREVPLAFGAGRALLPVRLLPNLRAELEIAVLARARTQ